DAPAGDSRPEPRDWEAQSGAGGFARGGSDWRRRIDRGSASRAGKSDQRRRAIVGPGAIRKNDARAAAVPSAVGPIEKDSCARSSELSDIFPACAGWTLRTALHKPSQA